jgi:hypothetical protein
VLDSVLSNATERETGSNGKDKMVDVRLDQSEHQSETDDFAHSDMVGSSTHSPFLGYDKRRQDSLVDDDEYVQQPPDDITIEMPRDESPPPFQQFKRPPREPSPSLAFIAPVEDEEARDHTPFLPQESKRPQEQQGTVWGYLVE